MKYTITRSYFITFYDSPLFSMASAKRTKRDILTTFYNGTVSVRLSREEAADVLKRHFKNNPVRRIRHSKPII
jgi:hypothetical protein